MTTETLKGIRLPESATKTTKTTKTTTDAAATTTKTTDKANHPRTASSQRASSQQEARARAAPERTTRARAALERTTRAFVPRLPDQFELLARLTALRRLVVAFGLLGMGFGFCALFVVFSVAVTPTKVVVWPDNPYAKPALVKAGDVTVREIDAKRFFLAMSDLLLGWNSSDVVERFDEAALQMNTSFRQKFREGLDQPVPVPEELSPKRTLPALAFMIKASVRNELRPIRLQDIRCERAGDQWNCRAVVESTTLPLYAPPDDNAPKKQVLVQAGFKEYPVTDLARYGLLVSYWEVKERSGFEPDASAEVAGRAPKEASENNGGIAQGGVK